MVFLNYRRMNLQQDVMQVFLGVIQAVIPQCCMPLFRMDINYYSDLSAISVQVYLDCSCNLRFTMLFTGSLLHPLVYYLCRWKAGWRGTWTE